MPTGNYFAGGDMKRDPLLDAMDSYLGGILYRWVDRRGKVPRWVRWLWPRTHFCPDWDFLLLTDGDPDLECCTCGFAPQREVGR